VFISLEGSWPRCSAFRRVQKLLREGKGLGCSLGKQSARSGRKENNLLARSAEAGNQEPKKEFNRPRSDKNQEEKRKEKRSGMARSS